MSTFRSSLFNFDVRDPVQIVRQTTQLPQTPLDLKDIRVAVLAIGLLVSFPQMIQFRVEIVMLVTKSIIWPHFTFLWGPSTLWTPHHTYFVVNWWTFSCLHYHYRHHHDHDHHPYHDYRQQPQLPYSLSRRLTSFLGPARMKTIIIMNIEKFTVWFFITSTARRIVFWVFFLTKTSWDLTINKLSHSWQLGQASKYGDMGQMSILWVQSVLSIDIVTFSTRTYWCRVYWIWLFVPYWVFEKCVVDCIGRGAFHTHCTDWWFFHALGRWRKKLSLLICQL